MIKILGFILINVIALMLSSISLVSTAAMMNEQFSVSSFMRLGIYLGILLVGLFFYKLGKKLLKTI